MKLLYTELVLAKEITEEEFWDGREVSFAFARYHGNLMIRHWYKLNLLHMSRNLDGHLGYWMTDSTWTQGEKGEWQQEEQESE